MGVGVGVCVGDALVEGVGDAVLVTEGEADRDVDGEAEGEVVATIATPLFQTNFFPDLIQVYFFPLKT